MSDVPDIAPVSVAPVPVRPLAYFRESPDDARVAVRAVLKAVCWMILGVGATMIPHFVLGAAHSMPIGSLVYFRSSFSLWAWGEFLSLPVGVLLVVAGMVGLRLREGGRRLIVAAGWVFLVLRLVNALGLAMLYLGNNIVRSPSPVWRWAMIFAYSVPSVFPAILLLLLFRHPAVRRAFSNRE